MGHQICNMLQESLLRVFMTHQSICIRSGSGRPRWRKWLKGFPAFSLVILSYLTFPNWTEWGYGLKMMPCVNSMVGLQGWRGSYSAKTWHTFSIPASVPFATIPNILEGEKMIKVGILAYIVVSFHSQIIPIIIWENACWSHLIMKNITLLVWNSCATCEDKSGRI